MQSEIRNEGFEELGQNDYIYEESPIVQDNIEQNA